jgi:phosphoglycolate phosphatase
MNAGILFDFDGTLVDTFEDIVAAVQRMRGRLGADPLPAEQTRRHIGWGIYNLIGQCHPRLDEMRPDNLPPDGEPLPVPADELQRAVDLFREAYGAALVVHTRPYPGMVSLCKRLDLAGASLAVVSNKPERFTRQLLAILGMADRFALVLGGDTLAHKKPSPQPLRWAARRLGVPLERCVMIGDSGLDIAAARAAGIPSIAVTWGLLSAQGLRDLEPTHRVDTAAQLEEALHHLLREDA